jgi:leucyl-tRNA synthetase
MSGQPGVETKWEKMSKSKGNGVDPTAIIKEVGVDSTRLNILFKVRLWWPPAVLLSRSHNFSVVG